MPSEIEYNELYLDIAKRISLMSKAVRLKVGAVIVKDHSIVSYGYNGTPTGDNNVCEYHEHEDSAENLGKVDELITKDDVIHAEMNALLKLVGSTESIKGSIMYITHAPCLRCSQFIVQTGAIKKVVYGEEYRDLKGADYLKSKGIEVAQAVNIKNDETPAIDVEAKNNIPTNVDSKELPKIKRAVNDPDAPNIEHILDRAKMEGGLQWQKIATNINELISPINEFMITLMIDAGEDAIDALKKDKITYAIVYNKTWIIYEVDTPISVHS